PARRVAQRGVRLLRRLRIHANAYAALFRAAHQCGRLRLANHFLTAHTDQLRKRRHSLPSFSAARRPNSCARKTSRALAGRADNTAREHTLTLKGLLRIRRNNQQETPYALQE